MPMTQQLSDVDHALHFGFPARQWASSDRHVNVFWTVRTHRPQAMRQRNYTATDVASEQLH